MKIFSLMLLAFSATLGVAIAADNQTVGSQARSGEQKEKQIQSDSQKLLADLDATIDEYQRNGLSGDEIKTLKKLRDIISKVSNTEIVKILDCLKQAGSSTDPKAGLKNLADAYSAQKGVMADLKRIIDADAAEQEAQELSDEATALADRQAANLQNGIETGQWALTGVKHDDAAVQASLETQGAEQKAISEDLKDLQKKINAFAKNPNNKSMADRFQKGFEESGRILPQIDSATDLLNQRKLFEAVAGEKTSRDQLRQLARTLSPPREEADALRVAVEKIDKIISQQKELIKATIAGKLPPIEQWVADILKNTKDPAHAIFKKLDLLTLPVGKIVETPQVKAQYGQRLTQNQLNLTSLETQEGDLVNQSDALSQDVAKIAKPAADSLQSAMPPMQTARGSLADSKAEDAGKSENEGLTWLEKAKDDLDQRLAAAEKTDKTEDPIAKLNELKQEAEKLAADQKALEKDTAAPKTPQQAADIAKKQGDMQQKAQQLQQKATNADAPAAAQSLSKAADNMQQAATAAANPAQAGQAVQAQEQAAQNLTNAAQQLGQQAAQMQQAQQQIAADQQALDDLAKIIEAEQKVQIDTVQATPNQIKQPDTVRAIAPRQLSVKDDTTNYRKSLTTANTGVPNGDHFLASASSHMGDAKGDLQMADGVKAQPQEQKALDDLFELQKALQTAQQNAQNQAGQNAQNAQAAADAQAAANAAAAVAQAQQQAAQAMNNLQQQNGQQAAAQLGDAAATVGAAAAQGNVPQNAQQAMQAAAQALTNAAGQAAADQNGQAQASGQQGQGQLAQAAAALAQAEAGISANGPPGSTPGTPDNSSSPTPDGPGAADTGGPAQGVNGRKALLHSKIMTLPERERKVIQQAQAEKYPPEYAGKIEQYLINLSEDGNRR